MRRIRPVLQPVEEGARPSLTPETLSEIDESAKQLAAEIAPLLTAALKARLEHVAVHIPEGQEQVLVARVRTAPPFFEVTTELG